MAITTRDLTDFYNNEFKEYALYTIHHRAIPTLMDCLKPVHKKILWTALRRAKSPIKTVSLGGYLMAEADYKHGDMSAIDSICKMASKWRNQINLLEGHGNFGWRMVPDAGAPRYTKVSISSNFQNWFSDFNALEYKPGDDGDFYEPTCYYANIPWFLVNGFNGIATGYSCFTHPRNPQKIANLIIDLLNGKVPKESDLDIEYPSYDGKIDDDSSVGEFRLLGRRRIEILSLPIEYTIDTFSPRLVKLVDQGIIKDFHKTVSQGHPPFVVELKEPLSDPEKTLGLRRKLREETLVFIHKDKLMTFPSMWDAVSAFVQLRLEVAGKGISASKASRSDTIDRIEVKVKFVDTLCKRGIKNLKRTDLIDIITSLGRPDMRETLLNMSASNMTEESIGIWKDQISELKSEIEILNQVTPIQWWKYNILNKPIS